MTHYICKGGCKGVSSEPGSVCQATDCRHYGQPLEECDCQDNKHNAAFEEEKTEEN